jgi:hypothetical protein
MAEETEPNNPVMRLYLVLEEARTKDPGWGVGKIWADVFSTGADSLELHLRLAELIQLVYDAQRTIEQLDDPNQSDFLAPFEKITRLVGTINLDQQWNKMREAYLDPMTMKLLWLAANAVSAQAGEISIREERLGELQAEVEALMKEVLDTAFSEELKAILVEKLKEIHTAILAYRISGLRGLRQAVESSLGAILFNEAEFKRPQDEKTTQFRIKLGAVIKDIAIAVTQGATEGLAGGIIAGLLPSGN